MLKIEVKDTGVGIEQRDIPNLFKKFGKLHRTAEMNNHGIGLGLLVVKQIVERQSGTLSVQSDGINRGSKFIFTLKMERVKLEYPSRDSHENG